MADLILMKICGKCKDEKPIVDFRTKYNKETKLCSECRREQIVNYSCTHGRIKYQCRECGGQSLCEHGYQKTQCKKCEGTGLCDHDKQADKCMECGNIEKIRIMTIIKSSRRADIASNRYDANNFIDYPFVEQLLFENNLCCYCGVLMRLDKYTSSMCTIERRDNNIGHTKANCTLCCLDCNRRRVGQVGR